MTTKCRGRRGTKVRTRRVSVSYGTLGTRGDLTFTREGGQNMNQIIDANTYRLFQETKVGTEKFKSA